METLMTYVSLLLLRIIMKVNNFRQIYYFTNMTFTYSYRPKRCSHEIYKHMSSKNTTSIREGYKNFL